VVSWSNKPAHKALSVRTCKKPLTNEEANELVKEVKKLGREERHALLKRLLPGQTNRDTVELEDPFIWAHTLHSRTLYISNRNSMNVPFIFESMHGTANEKALLNSGVMECFLDKQMVSHLGIGMKQLPAPRKVHNVDGTKNWSGTITKYCSLWIQIGTHEVLQRFFVTNLGHN
jgi:hypothetical protein